MMVIRRFFACALLFTLPASAAEPPKVTVSKETTYITEPLDEDGLPDYRRAMLERMRKNKVPPEENGAVLFWQAVWPGKLDETERKAICKELGFKPPTGGKPFEPIDGIAMTERVVRWLAEQRRIELDEFDSLKEARESIPDVIDLLESDADELISEAYSRPCKTTAIPPIVTWLENHDQRLDQLVEASKRPHWYDLSPSLLVIGNEPVLVIVLHGPMAIRDAVRGLNARAMANAEKRRFADAWIDCHAALRLSRQASTGLTIVEHLVAIKCQELCKNSTLAVLEAAAGDQEITERILRDLEKLPSKEPIAGTFEVGERIVCLNAILWIARGRTSEFIEHGEVALKLAKGGGDWNYALREANRWFNQMEAVGKLASWPEQKAASETINKNIREQVVEKMPSVATMLSSQQARSRGAAHILLAVLLPSSVVAYELEHQDHTERGMLEVSAALAVYHARHGRYPGKLDELVPGVVTKLPGEVFCDNPFLYRQTVDGYLLYSRGPNGKDDGANNDRRKVVRGYKVSLRNMSMVQSLLKASSAPKDAVDDETPVPEGSDDIAIRLPLPKVDIAEIVAGP